MTPAPVSMAAREGYCAAVSGNHSWAYLWRCRFMAFPGRRSVEGRHLEDLEEDVEGQNYCEQVGFKRVVEPKAAGRVLALEAFDRLRVEVALSPDALRRQHLLDPGVSGANERGRARREPAELLARGDLRRHEFRRRTAQDVLLFKVLQVEVGRPDSGEIAQRAVEEQVAHLDGVCHRHA